MTQTPVHDLEHCTRRSPCSACLNVRSKALSKVGPQFPALGAIALQGFIDNA